MSEWNRARPVDARPEEWDAALRLSDRVTTHLIGAGDAAWHRYLAARLEDGGADPDTLYDTRDDAIRSVLHSQYYAYPRVAPSGMSPLSAHHFLQMARSLYARYGQRHDVAGQHIIMPNRAELGALIAPRAFRSNGRI